MNFKRFGKFELTSFVAKKLILIACVLFAANVSADNQAILSQIEKANAAVKSLTSPFEQVKTVPASKTKVPMNGTLFFESGKMAMHYVQPVGDILVINGKQFFMVREGKKMAFDTSKNAPMRSLSNTLVYCMQGKASQLASENNAEIAVSETKTHYVVTLTARKKAARGYKSIVLHYAKSSNLLTKMIMTEFNGISNEYNMTNYAVGAKIEPAKFNVPKK